MRNVVVLASGNGSLLQALIDAPERGDKYEIVAVVSDKPECFAIERARQAGIIDIAMSFQKLQVDQWQQQLKAAVLGFNPDLVVSAGFMRIIRSDLYEIVPTINAHPSLLPNFPGAHAVADALAAGVETTGATVHFIDAGVDSGKILSQQSVPVYPNDSVQSLHERIKVVERIQLTQVVVKLCQQDDLWAGLN